MDLREFVSQTLTQIVEGVKEAHVSVSKLGGKVSPMLRAPHAQLGEQGILNADGGTAQIVRFDVALTVVEGAGTKGGIGIFAGAISLGTSGQSKTESSSVSHVQFSVPIILPNADNNG